jgi:hypothetical protein
VAGKAVTGADRSPGRAGGPAVILLVAAQIAAAAIGLRESAPRIFPERPPLVIPAEQSRDIRFIRGWIPDDEPLLYLSDGSDPWTPRTWERAMSPEPVVFVVTGNLRRAVSILRRRFRIRWALSAGAPPMDPGFVWRVRFAPLPGTAEQYWFGRLSD